MQSKTPAYSGKICQIFQCFQTGDLKNFFHTFCGKKSIFLLIKGEILQKFLYGRIFSLLFRYPAEIRVFPLVKKICFFSCIINKMRCGKGKSAEIIQQYHFIFKVPNMVIFNIADYCTGSMNGSMRSVTFIRFAYKNPFK